MNPPVRPAEIRLAMLGMIDGNAHPYSWSAIINGYDPDAMREAVGDRYPVIPQYLGRQPLDQVRIDGARVTHVWTDDPEEAPRIAAAARIPDILRTPDEAIGHIDAAVIATDDGNDHIDRARPFIEAGIPVFIDKPLAINLPDLRQFAAWEREGKLFLSSSGLRYSPELAELKQTLSDLGTMRWVTGTTVKTWERYGVHALEPVFTLLGPGFTQATTVAVDGANVVTVAHQSGSIATIAVLPDAPGSSGVIEVCGTRARRAVKMADTYTAFRNQMIAFIDTVRDGRAPYPFSETLEIMLILIAGIRSREQGGQPISLEEIKAEIFEKELT